MRDGLYVKNDVPHLELPQRSYTFINGAVIKIYFYYESEGL
jgi:hypothetical protein